LPGPNLPTKNATAFFGLTLVRQTFIDADICQCRHSLIQTFIDADIRRCRHSSMQTFVDADIRRCRHSLMQTFVDADIRRCRHSSTINTFIDIFGSFLGQNWLLIFVNKMAWRTFIDSVPNHRLCHSKSSPVYSVSRGIRICNQNCSRKKLWTFKVKWTEQVMVY
jgi:hypothetical protein